MTSEELIERTLRLTRALYRVTDKLPHDEPLRKVLRERALEIVAEACGDVLTSSRVRVMQEYLKITLDMDWMPRINFDILLREYQGLYREALDKNPRQGVRTHDEVVSATRHPSAEVKNVYQTTSITERQKMMLEHLRQTGQGKISDFFSRFNTLSAKTIQRDLQDLVAKSILKKEGEKRWTRYMCNVQ